MIRDCKAFQKLIVDRYSLVDAFFRVFNICVIGKQHVEDCEWNGVERGNTVVFLWCFRVFWLLTVATSPVESAAYTCTSQVVLAALDRDTNL